MLAVSIKWSAWCWMQGLEAAAKKLRTLDHQPSSSGAPIAVSSSELRHFVPSVYQADLVLSGPGLVGRILYVVEAAGSAPETSSDASCIMQIPPLTGMTCWQESVVVPTLMCASVAL